MNGRTDPAMRQGVSNLSGGKWAVASAILAAAYLFPFVRVLSAGHDEGISVLNAARVLQGQIPARDFIEVIGPGEFYWLALFFKLLGTSIFTAHFALLLAGISFSVLFFHLARRAGADPILCCSLLTAVSIPLFEMNSYHWDSNLFALLSFAALIEWQRSKRGWLLGISGFLAALATLIMQQKGIILCAALLLSSSVIGRSEWKKSAVRLLAPYLAVLAAAGIFFAAHGALRDLVWANLLWPLSRYSNVNKCPYAFNTGVYLKAFASGFTFLPAYLANSLGCFLILPLLIVVATPGLLVAIAVRLRRKAFSPILIPFWICGSALWLSEFQRPDIAHLLFGCPILLIALFALLRLLPAPAWITRVIFVAVALFGAMNLGACLSANVKVQTRRGTLLGRTENSALNFLQQHTARGEDVFIYPYSPLYNFLSDTRNPTRFSYLIYGWHTPEQFAEAVADLERKRVRYILSDTAFTTEGMVTRFPNYRAPPADQQVVERYIDSHYREVGRESGYRILERLPQPASASPGVSTVVAPVVFK